MNTNKKKINVERERIILDVKTGYIEKNKKGKIKIRKITKEKAYFWVVFLFLIIISLYKIITINVGEINISDSFKDFF